MKRDIAVPQVKFLEFLIDGTSLHPTAAKMKSILEAPPPCSKAELQAFLGLLNFYTIFLLHKASVAEPLHWLLDVKSPWSWGTKDATAFRAVKQLLISNTVLIQYNENLLLLLTVWVWHCTQPPVA